MLRAAARVNADVIIASGKAAFVALALTRPRVLDNVLRAQNVQRTEIGRLAVVWTRLLMVILFDLRWTPKDVMQTYVESVIPGLVLPFTKPSLRTYTHPLGRAIRAVAAHGVYHAPRPSAMSLSISQLSSPVKRLGSTMASVNAVNEPTSIPNAQHVSKRPRKRCRLPRKPWLPPLRPKAAISGGSIRHTDGGSAAISFLAALTSFLVRERVYRSPTHCTLSGTPS